MQSAKVMLYVVCKEERKCFGDGVVPGRIKVLGIARTGCNMAILLGGGIYV